MIFFKATTRYFHSWVSAGHRSWSSHTNRSHFLLDTIRRTVPGRRDLRGICTHGGGISFRSLNFSRKQAVEKSESQTSNTKHNRFFGNTVLHAAHGRKDIPSEDCKVTESWKLKVEVFYGSWKQKVKGQKKVKSYKHLRFARTNWRLDTKWLTSGGKI